MTIKSRLAKLENSSSISNQQVVIVINIEDDKRLLNPEFLEEVMEEKRKENPGRDIVFVLVTRADICTGQAEIEI